LEYVQIPTLQETIRSIAARLEENERSNTARLMKIKDMMVAEARAREESA
jgi:V/A-type H+-transporting ATPase subunit D